MDAYGMWPASWVVEELETMPGGAELAGEKEATATGVASIREATASHLTFCSWDGDRAVAAVGQSAASIVLCRRDLRSRVSPHPGQALVFLDNPRMAFVRLAKQIQKAERDRRRHLSRRISPLAVIASSASIDSSCLVGNHVIIGEDCVIGANTVIHDRVYIGDGCRVGDNCTLYSGVTVGEDGFAYERYDDGSLEKFPHFKAVIIGDNVEIYANSNIARGSLTDTVVGSGTKIDAMVHVAHNVRIGKNCMLTAGTIIGGSTTIGDSVWFGLNSTAKHQIAIGSNVIVGAGACVLKDIPDGDVVAGVPAKSIKDRVSTPEVFLMAGQKKEHSTPD